MSEYRRFIAYIYEYRNGKKEKNAGFVKADVRGGSCRLQIRLQTGTQGNQRLDCYGFVRQQEQILGILLGSGQLRQGRMELRLLEPEQSMGQGGEPVSFAELSGLWIQGEDRLFLTIWDEEPVDVTKFTVQPAADEAGMEQPPEKTVTEQPWEETVMERPPEEMSEHSGGATRIPEESLRERLGDSDSNMKSEPDGTDCERDSSTETLSGRTAHGQHEESDGSTKTVSDKETKDRKEDIDDSTKTVSDKVNQEQKEDVDGSIKTVPDGVMHEQEKADLAAQDASVAVFLRPDTDQPLTMSTRSATGLESRWPQFQYHYPREYPFEDEEIRECLRIALKDLDYLGAEGRAWCALPFVQQRYLKYRHLLLGRHENGKFILGVPGLNRNMQDVHLAAMYGFPEFKSGGDGAFGYWYRFLR